MSALGKESRDQDLSDQLQGLKRSITDYRNAYGLDSLMTSERSRPSRRDNHGSGQYGSGSGTGGHAMEMKELEMHGYVVIPDVIEDKGGRIEPLIKVWCRNPLFHWSHSDFSAAAAPHSHRVSVSGHDPGRVYCKAC
jgi:hypothetical protein